MDNREFQRLFRRAVKLFKQTADGKNHGLDRIMDELVVECDDEQWSKVAAAFGLEDPAQALQETGKVN